MGVPTEQELNEQVFYLAFRLEGTGLGFSYNEIMSMSPKKRHWFVNKLSERYQEIEEQVDE